MPFKQTLHDIMGPLILSDGSSREVLYLNHPLNWDPPTQKLKKMNVSRNPVFLKPMFS